ncbi:MAG: dihydrolipoyllysine-residue acetyltransferase [Wenzhouxiangella sp.]
MSSRQDIRVPDIGDFEQVPVIEVLVAEGDTVAAEQSLITLESDKATMDVPAPAAGRLVELTVAEGDTVSEGDVIGVLELGAEASGSGSGVQDSGGGGADGGAGDNSENPDPPESRIQKPQSGSPEPRTPNPETGSSATASPVVPFEDLGSNPASLPHASPSLRRLARELGVDLQAVQGSGRKGRIRPEDLKSFVKSRLSEPGAASGSGGLPGLAPPPAVDFSKFGEIEEKPLSRIQKISGPNLHRNWVSIPHVTQFDEADITEMEAFRKASQKDAEQAGTKMTPLVFLIKAVVAALKRYPQFNASLSNDGETLICKKYFHVGVAVDTPGGLVVPVLRDCDQKGLIDLAVELTEVSGRAREGKLKSDEMKGGCFTISSLGGIGGTAFTPIINAPELAILGVSRAAIKPVWNGGEFEPRLTLPLSLSYDHRVIDGAAAARFTRYLAERLEDVRRLLL